MSGDLPPGPGLLRILGFVRQPFAFLDACARRYGDWFTLRVPGVPPFVFTSDPAAIQEIFAGDPDTLHAGEANRPLAAFMGEHSMLFLDGAAHLRERRLLLPPFHGERMQGYATIMREITDRAVDEWPVGRSFPLHPSFQSITFEVILRTVFGLETGPESARLRDRLSALFELFSSPLGALLGVPALRVDLGPLSPWGRAVELNAQIESLLFAEFARRRAAGSEGRDDVLSLLLAARDEAGEPMSDTRLRDEMLTLLLAGHETTAAALAWTVHRLLGTPAAMEKVRAELAAVVGGGPLEARHLGELRYLDAVIRESIRLDPVIPNVGRRLTAPLTIAGRALPAGVVVAPCIYLAHRRAESWPAPERFDPDRFLDARPAPSVFLPFGGGVRRCLGAAFATYEMKVVLAEVLSRVVLTPDRTYRPGLRRRSIAIAPSRGLPVVVAARLR